MIKKLFAFIVIFGVVTGIAYQLFTIQNNIAVVKPVEAPETLTPPQPQISGNQPSLVGSLPATQSDTGADLGENINNKGKDEALEQKTPQERIPFVRNLTPSDIVPIVTRPVVIIPSEPTPPAIVPPQATVITNDIDVISMTTTEPLPIAITPIVAEPIDVITDNTKIIDIIALETITPINIKMAMLTSEGKALAIEKIQVDKKDQGSISKLEIIKAGVSDEVIQAKEIISWHKNGEKRSSVIVKQGQKQGLETIWHDNATKSIETMYVDGVKNGTTNQWNRQGEETLSGIFVKGKLATATNYTYHDNHIQASKVGTINGLKQGEEVMYFATGEKSTQSEYVLGVKEGVSVKLFKSGVISSTEDYTKGQLNGTVQTWNEQGLILEQSYYVNGLKRNSVEWIYNADNQLISETILFANEKDGLQTKWHDNTLMSSLGSFKKDQKQGVHTTWFENGKILSLENFKNNQKEGIQTHWDNQGQKTKELEYIGSIVTRETSFMNGQKHGIETLRYAHGPLRETQTYQEGDNVDISKWYDEQGRLLRVRNYKNKILLSEILYSKGLRHGKARMYYSNGKIAREVDYVNGKKHGKQTHYHSDGNKDLEASYIKDALDGLLTTYSASSEVNSATTYKDNVKHGLRQIFYASGSIHSEETFAHDERDGWMAWFYKNGSLDQAIHYSNGVISDDKLEVYIPTTTGSTPMREWLKINVPIAHDKAYPNTTGLVISKNEMGEVDFIANYVMGIKQGLNITFYPNGRKKRELTWKDGVGGYVSNLNGKLTDWNEAGNKVYEAYYKPNLASSAKASIWSDNKENASGGYYKTTEHGAYLHGGQSYFDDQGQINKSLFWQNNQLQ